MLIKTNRRRFLGALGTATFAASAARFFLRSAEAQEFPKRFVFIFTPNGQDENAYSSGLGANYTLGPDMQMFNELKSKFTVLDGLRIPEHGGEEHPAGRCAMLSSWKSAGTNETADNRGQTFDIFLANKLTNGNSIYCGDTTPPDFALDLPISWLAPGVRNDNYLHGVGPLMSRLFQNSPAPSPTPGDTTSSTTQNDLALNDYLRTEVDRLRAVAPAAEMTKLDLHLQALAQIRADLDPTGSGGVALRNCESALELSGKVSDQMGLLLAHGLACGQTRIAVFRIGDYEPNHVHSHWEEGSMDGVQGIRSEFRRINQEWAQSVLNFLKHLESFPEGNGTLLDNTVVVWSSEVSNHYASPRIPRDYPEANLGEGDNNTHGTVEMPFWLAGSLGGTLKAGQRIMAQDRWSGELYKAIGTAMGLTSAELQGYGEAKYAPGPLTEIMT